MMKLWPGVQKMAEKPPRAQGGHSMRQTALLESFLLCSNISGLMHDSSIAIVDQCYGKYGGDKMICRCFTPCLKCIYIEELHHPKEEAYVQIK